MFLIKNLKISISSIYKFLNFASLEKEREKNIKIFAKNNNK